MEIELDRMFRASRRYWWLALGVAAVLGLIFASIGVVMPRSYTTDSSMFIVPTSSLVGNPDTIIELSRSERVLRPILKEFGIDESAKDFARNNLNSYAVTGTSIVRIEVTYSDAQTAADITNAIANAVTSRSFDMGLGVLERDLSNLNRERDEINLQLVSIDAQIDELGLQDENLSSEDSARLDELHGERLRLQQRRADFLREIREAENAIATYLVPVIVNDVAVPVEVSDGVSPLVLGAVGFLLGGFAGTALMLWLELRDHRVRDGMHMESIGGGLPVLVYTGVDSSKQNGMSNALLAQRVAGRAGSAPVLIAVPRSSSQTDDFTAELSKQSALVGHVVHVVDSVLDSAEGITPTGEDCVGFLIVEREKTTEVDVIDSIATLQDLGVGLSATILIG